MRPPQGPSSVRMMRVPFLVILVLAACANAFPEEAQRPLSRSFELVYHSTDPKFNGRTDFKPRKGEADIGTDQRIECLRLLAKRLAQEAGGEEKLDQLVVTPERIAEVKRSLKPLPE